MTFRKQIRSLLLITYFSCIVFSGHAQTKAYIDKDTKEFFLTANIKNEHKIFGYESADTASKKLILFSVFTNDVKDNPYKCPLGAYYETSNLTKGDKIEFVSVAGNFVKLNYISTGKRAVGFYIELRYIEFI